jgi:hypothetical protein
LKYASQNQEWDQEALNMMNWIKEQEKKLFNKEFYDKFNNKLGG